MCCSVPASHIRRPALAPFPRTLKDSYRRQLGLSMQRRLRHRIRTGFLRRVTVNRGGSGARLGMHIRHDSINILLSIAGGALLLACPGGGNGRERNSRASRGQELVGGKSGAIGGDRGGEVGVGRPGEPFVPGDDDHNTAGEAEQFARSALAVDKEEVDSGGGDGYFGGREALLVLGYLAAVAAAASAAAAVADTSTSAAAAVNSSEVQASVADYAPVADGGALVNREGLAAEAASGSSNGGGGDRDGRCSGGALDGGATPVGAKGDTVVIGQEGGAGVGRGVGRAERRSVSRLWTLTVLIIGNVFCGCREVEGGSRAVHEVTSSVDHVSIFVDGSQQYHRHPPSAAATGPGGAFSAIRCLRG